MFTTSRTVPVVVHTESPSTGPYANILFKVKYTVETQVLRIPENTDHSPAELQDMFRRQYGPFTIGQFVAILQRNLEKFEHLHDMNPKQCIDKFYLSSRIYGIARKSFGLISASLNKLMMGCFKGANQIIRDANAEKYRDPRLYPNQRKLKRAMKSAKNSAGRYIRLVVDYFNQNPQNLFKIPVEYAREFLQSHNNLHFTIYCGRISRQTWLHESITEIVQEKYKDYKKNAWQSFLFNHVKLGHKNLGADICQNIAEYISETTALELKGRSFADYFQDHESYYLGDSTANIPFSLAISIPRPEDRMIYEITF